MSAARLILSPQTAVDQGRADGTDQKESPTVVDAAPVYTKDEAAGAHLSVVHEMAYPVQNNKWYRLNPESLTFTQTGTSHVHRVPKLAHGLERVLFSPGVHCLQDPHSHVYNFDPYIRNITQPAEFDYDKLTPYITSSKDQTLMQYARDRKKQFVGSTSSMTHVLSHLYFIVSAWKQPDVSCMSMAFNDMPSRYTRSMRYPASISLRYHDGVYGIDADKSFDVQDSILSILGKSLEKLLTSTPQEFDMFKKQNSWQVKEIPEENYHYVMVDDFTRGSLAIRMDMENYEISKGYQINNMKGRLESFEREYYDMIRSAFLKYNFQTRIGNMDGIFVAYHNTAKMFGFQYINRGEMDRILYGNEATGNKAFKAVLILLGKVLRTTVDQYPKKDLRVTFDSETSDRRLNIWVEVIDDEAEAVAMQQYSEEGFLRSLKQQKGAMKKQKRQMPGATDPFATTDPLDTASKSDQDLIDELADECLDPSEEIYVNTTSFSTVNNADTDEPVTVRSKDDEWFVNWRLTKSRDPQSDIQRHYRALRLKQATYFERAAPDTPEDELSPLVKILRRISRRNLWKNKTPKGKIVINRSRKPISPDLVDGTKEATGLPPPAFPEARLNPGQKPGPGSGGGKSKSKGSRPKPKSNPKPKPKSKSK
ncbi:Pet127-domain-containing protein [Linderina pennispora]|uniref:Pet127-domain-containing protein n=1 Tax=Linderina pennispora TaxID=61395 RepID=A0A1Y1WKX3_9FUNG|nr:Pet127-domain-containing protein [Linderina pennispora]ORX73734.1 Pet127-domain-containing protein [Linderina pennispora]